MRYLKYTLPCCLILLCGLSLPLFALSDGIYVLDYSKTTSFPEMEQQYASVGLDIRQQTVETYKGVVINIEEDSFMDPVELLSFDISRKGEISCRENPTVTGLFNRRSGELSWTGYLEHYGQLKYTIFSGILEKTGRRDRAAMDSSLVYQLENSRGDEMTASFQDGFLLLKLKVSEGSPYEGWPLMVNPDGTFLSSLEIATEVITGQTDAPPIVQALHNAAIVTEGKINADGSINISFYDDFAQTREGQIQPKTSFSGTVLNTQEMSLVNEASYEDFTVTLKSRAESDRASRSYPDWYINPPSDPQWWYAAGCRTLPDRNGALKMAETIAASVLSSQINVRVQSEFLDREDDSTRVLQDRITESSKEAVDYEIAESFYDQNTQRAYVLIRMPRPQQ